MKFTTHLRRIFRLTPYPKKGKNKLLMLIDFHDHRRGGHFGLWMYWFATEFSKRFDRVVVVTPDPKSIQNLFIDKGEGLHGNLTFLKLPKRLQKKFDLDYLQYFTDYTSCNPHAFIMWGYDLLNFKSIRQTTCPWATLIGTSWMCRNSREQVARNEKKILEILKNDVSCKGFFQPDFFLRDRYKKGVWITDIEDVSLSEKVTPLLRSISDFNKKRLCIGIFGMLHGYRCVNEILLLARAQPKVNFVLAGKIFYESVQKDLIGDLEPGRCKNLLVLPGFIETDSELNSAISLVDGIFIDSENYPVQSGIVCRALHFGRWILSSPGDSWTNDVIADGKVGLTYKNREMNLYQSWKKWKEKGGENRSREYSNQLRDTAVVASCFDELTKRLIQT